MRSIAQLTRDVISIATISTITSATTIEPIPSQVVRMRKVTSAMKADTMNTSPWAKFTMPMMPNTMV